MGFFRHRLAILATVALSVLAGCDKAPNGIIKESKMVDLIVDLDKADAYVTLNPDKFTNDSTKLLLKESVLAKHGVTLDDYSKSLGWYAANIDVLIKVQDKAMKKLENESKKIDAQAKKEIENGMNSQVPGNTATGSAHKTYPNHGDTADIWEGNRQWTLMPSLGKGYITFDLHPDKNARQGDRYQLCFKMLGFDNSFKVMLAADYIDGSTAFVARKSGTDSWETFNLQCDSSKVVRRIYGYVQYNINRGAMAFVDSVALLRTHMNSANYTSIVSQKLVVRNFGNTAPQPAPQVAATANLDDRRRQLRK